MPTFFDVGQFYFCEAVSFKTDPNLHSPKALGYELPKLLAIDIDTPDDWRLAELIYQAQAMANLSTNEPVSQPVNESAL